MAAGGEFGAAEVSDAEGRRLVLKPGDGRAAAAVTEMLSKRGYPVPTYVVAQRGYSVQEKLPGAPLPVVEPLPAELLDRVLELNELQAEPLGGLRRRMSPIRRAVFIGAKPWVDLRRMRSHSDEAARLLARCRRIVRAYGRHIPLPNDVQHFDFSPDNVLAEEGRVTGVIDWEGVRAGDRLFDLATFYFYSGFPDALRRYVVERVGERVLAVYLAYLSVRQTAWSIRFHEPGVGDAMIVRYHALLDTVPS